MMFEEAHTFRETMKPICVELILLACNEKDVDSPSTFDDNLCREKRSG